MSIVRKNFDSMIDEGNLDELRGRITLLEAELALRDGLETLAGGIGHDFNNLLTVILNNISMMKMDADSGSTTMTSLEEMEKATLKARDLALKLLNIASSGPSVDPQDNMFGDMEKVIDALNGSGRILLVEDEEDVRKSTGAALGKLGYEVVLAENGSNAIEIFCQSSDEGKPFDAVILDLTVHGGNGGRETLTNLKRIHPDIIAVVSSGYANDSVMTRYEEFGFSGRLVKPYTIEDLGRVMKSVLDKTES